MQHRFVRLRAHSPSVSLVLNRPAALVIAVTAVATYFAGTAVGNHDTIRRSKPHPAFSKLERLLLPPRLRLWADVAYLNDYRVFDMTVAGSRITIARVYDAMTE